MMEDTALVLRSRGGDLMAFEALYNKYRNQVYRTAVGLVREPAAAEEILQDCFLRVHANLGKLDGERGLAPWLHRVTVNLCYTYLARHKKQADSLDDLAEVLPCNPSTTPERSLMRTELESAIRDGIDSLEFSHRTVVVLYYLQGFSVEEIAYTLQCPVGTVKSRLFYARDALRSRLSPYRTEVGLPAAVAA
jgi:RNA polymerase sigma-70 factor (ECF subfamily)